nr:uncharacterized protein LOC103910262 [Danio rerio]|eukprot:XP_017210270.2 uncharacterized protein LOC103910262 [Danio rerio]
MTSSEERLCRPRGRGERPMHRSTLTLGDRNTCFYSTTHTESFSRRGHDGQALIFPHRNPCYPSQHNGKLDLKNIPVTQGQTHSRDEYGPKEIIPHYVLHQAGLRNRTQNRQGFVMKEVTNPTEPTPYQSTYHTAHCSRYQTNEDTSGRPVYWHSHNIITGQEEAAAGPGRPRRQSGESVLWEVRRWETHHDSLRLY